MKKCLRRTGRRSLIAALAIIGAAFGGCSGSNATNHAPKSPSSRTRIALTTTSGGLNFCVIGEIDVLFSGTVIATEPTDCADASILVALATGGYTVRPKAGYRCESDGKPIDCLYQGPSDGVPVTVVENENTEVKLPFLVGSVIFVDAGTIKVGADPVTLDCGDDVCDPVNEICATVPFGTPIECKDRCTPPDGECPDGEHCLDLSQIKADTGVCIPDENSGGAGGVAGAAGAGGMAGNGGAVGASGAAGESGAGGASGSGGAAGEGGEAGMAGEAGAGGAAGSSEGGAAGESGAGGTTGGSCNGNDANCPGDDICVNNTCVPPSSGGGTTGSGGTTGGGGSGDLVPVEIRYVRPMGYPEPVEVLVKGYVPGYADNRFIDLCNSNNPDVDKFERNGDEWSCVQWLPSTWVDGNYNVVYRVASKDAGDVPSGIEAQDYCWQPGTPRVCSGDCYEFFGQLYINGISTNDKTCRHWNGLEKGGCNTTPNDCD